MAAVPLFQGYRVFCWSWWGEKFNPQTYLRWVRWNLQRMRRGYSDHDWWGFNSYLCDIIPMALEDFKDGSGYPGSLASMDEWREKLDVMIAGFRASNDITNMNWPEHLDVASDEWKAWHQERKDTERKGLLEFVEWFGNLWD